MSDLIPCPGCQRHIRVDEDACPFCESSFEAPASPRRLPFGRFTRAAVFSGAIVAATASAGCGGDDDGPSPDAQVSDAGPADGPAQLPYGAPPARERLV